MRSTSRQAGLIIAAFALESLLAAGSGRAAQVAEAPAPPPVPVTGEAQPGLESFDELMVAFVAEHEVTGAALAVARDGRLVYARGFGRMDAARDVPVAPDALFRIASISKPVTAAAVLKLVQDGRLSLDAPVEGLLAVEPHLAAGGAVDPRLGTVTVRQLLQHRGGWDRDASFDPMFRSVEFARELGVPPPAGAADVIRAMWGRPLDFDPGARYAYSNFGYCVLGRVIERVTARGYEAWVKDEVLAPLGVTRMRVGATRAPAEGEVRYHARGARPGRSVFAADLGAAVPQPYGAWCLEAMDAHGGWIASAPDLVRFACGLDDGRLLDEARRGELFARPDEGEEPVYYALGWSVRVLPDGRGVNAWHTGALAGTSTLLVRRHDGLRWAVLFNGDSAPSGARLAGRIDPLVHRAADRVRDWPSHDLFRAGPAEGR